MPLIDILNEKFERFFSRYPENSFSVVIDQFKKKQHNQKELIQAIYDEFYTPCIAQCLETEGENPTTANLFIALELADALKESNEHQQRRSTGRSLYHGLKRYTAQYHAGGRVAQVTSFEASLDADEPRADEPGADEPGADEPGAGARDDERAPLLLKRKPQEGDGAGLFARRGQRKKRKELERNGGPEKKAENTKGCRCAIL